MALFKRNDNGIMDIIRCDETDYLIWKWHPSNSHEKNSNRENSIVWGSSLRVKDGSVAVFVYPQEGGKYQDFFEGPRDEIIKTSNLPVLAGLLGKLYDGTSPFQAEVYFINLANIIQTKFGVPFFDVYDPRFIDYPIPTAVRGSISFHIADYRDFIKLHRLDTFNIHSFQEQIKDVITRNVKSIVMNAPDQFGIQINQLERQIAQINSLVEKSIRSALQSDFGITVTRVDISDIEIDKESKGYKKIQSITQNKVSVFAQAATSIVDTVNIHRAGAKKVVKTRKDSVKNEKKRNDIFSSFKRKDKTNPPPLPTIKYYVAINDKQEGPYSFDELRQLAEDESLTKTSLVWKEGMENWISAGNVKDLESLFG